MGGATLDEPVKEGQTMKSNGSALVVQADTQEAAMELVKSDIYSSAGVWNLDKVRSRRSFEASRKRIALLTLVWTDADISIQVCSPEGLVDTEYERSSHIQRVTLMGS